MSRTPERGELAIGRWLFDQPDHAPGLLALLAVEVLGPRARDWAAEIRATYPNATPDGLATLATRRFVRLAGTGAAVSTAAGLFAPLAELALTSWVQGALVLHLAAAYGQDPTHPDRAVDLLLLSGVQPDEERARTAVATAQEAKTKTGTGTGTSAAELIASAQRLATQLEPLISPGGGWIVVRLAARLIPGVAPLAAAGGGTAGAERLAARAAARYRPRRPASGPSIELSTGSSN